MKYNVETLESLYKGLFDYIGLKDFKYEFNALNNEAAYSLWFGTKISAADVHYNSAEEFVNKILNPISESIKNSDAVKDAQIEFTKKIEEQENHIKLLQSKIRHLEPFENYYNLALKMQHG